MLWLSVALGGALGAMARYAISVALVREHIKFPVATLTANVLGCLIMGVCYVIIVEKGLIPQAWRHTLMIGFLGAFTTFSTFSLESLHLLQSGHWQIALLYVGLSMVFCIFAVFLGITITNNLL